MIFFNRLSRLREDQTGSGVSGSFQKKNKAVSSSPQALHQTLEQRDKQGKKRGCESDFFSLFFCTVDSIFGETCSGASDVAAGSAPTAGNLIFYLTQHHSSLEIPDHSNLNVRDFPEMKGNVFLTS